MFRAAHIPVGIAPTEAILENLYAVVTCCEAKIPLVIKGPPGCSKTLSFTIAANNMKGPASSQLFFQLFHQLQTFRYQCSMHSTDKEIEAVYEAAERRQMMFSDVGNARSSDRSVVFLDEGGLPSEARNALKVIHYKLDHPVVSSVIMTNRMLDAAKSNRAMLVVRDIAADDDGELLPLARGIFEIAAEDTAQARLQNRFVAAGSHSLQRTDAILRGIADAFGSVNKLSQVARSGLIYQRRDFIHLLRHLHRCSRKSGAGSVVITAEGLLDSVQRHLNGLHQDAFKAVASHFFDHVNRRLAALHLSEFEIPPLKNTLQLIRESLADRVLEGEDPNVSTFRYILVIDPTANETAVQLLRSRILSGSNTRVCALGDFAQDRSEAAQIEVISQVKSAMSEGQTVILINSEPIQTSFYDVFNRHFSVEYVRAQ